MNCMELHATAKAKPSATQMRKLLLALYYPNLIGKLLNHITWL
jgi:hypothetical protein